MAIRMKQRTSEGDWREAMNKIESTITKPQIARRIEITANDIIDKTKGKKAAYSWSAGKDSIVLQKVCEVAGIKDCVFVYCDLEYRQFMDWVNAHKPNNCTMINTHQDLAWLVKHQNMLFPQDAKTAAKWFKIVQHTGQESYYKAHNLDMILLGRRRADGNYVGKGNNIYTNAKGITRFSPLADWTHEEVLACIHYYNLPLPPIYGWKNGYLCGTHNWAERQWTGSVANGWKEIYEIEPEIVHEASKYFESAGEFLNGQTEEKSNA